MYFTVFAVLKVHDKGLRVVLRGEDLPEVAETLPRTYLTFPVTTLPFTWVVPAPFADLVSEIKINKADEKCILYTVEKAQARVL